MVFYDNINFPVNFINSVTGHTIIIVFATKTVKPIKRHICIIFFELPEQQVFKAQVLSCVFALEII